MSSNSHIRVMLVDDHPIMRRGLQEELEDAGGFEVVAQAADGEEAVATAQQVQPDVIVMDVMMPRKDGVEACRDILDLLPDTQVLMLTASSADDAVIESIAAGATGFVQKYSDSDQLLQAIRNVAAGRLMIPDDAVKRTFALIRGDVGELPAKNVLTAREREMLTHYARGMSYAQIGAALGVTMVTARNAIYRVQGKLGVKSKQEIVVWAVKNGLLDDPEA